MIAVGAYKPVSDPVRMLAERVLVGDQCWEWRGYRNAAGYGVARVGDVAGQLMLAHRLSWSALVGPIVDGMHVLHQCDNPGCVRPDHLFLGTNADNIADRVSKGRPGCQHWKGSGERHPTARLSDAQCAEIRSLGASGMAFSEIAARFGITRRHAWAICRGLARRVS